MDLMGTREPPETRAALRLQSMGQLLYTVLQVGQTIQDTSNTVTNHEVGYELLTNIPLAHSYYNISKTVAAIVNSKVSFSKRLFFVVVSENKFYLNKGLNTLHNIKTEEGGKKPKNQFTSQGIGQLLLVSCKLYSYVTDNIGLKFVPLSKV